jgi:hypothetical protein
VSFCFFLISVYPRQSAVSFSSSVFLRVLCG